MFERATVPENALLRCVTHSGAGKVLDATVTDVSQGGIGLQLGHAGDVLVPGMVLQGCRIECHDREPVIVDLEVRQTTTAILPDGRRVVRAGCRFVDLSPSTIALVAEYFRGSDSGSEA